MQNIIEIKQNWPADYFKIDLYVGNICNFQCWYCWPGCHEGDIKWPDFDLLVKNLSHLLDYYLEHTDKKKFQISMLGGEVTHWHRFVDFIKYFKENYDCVFSMHTNASKKLAWWKTAAPHLDLVSISHHDAFSKKEHNREVADYLYSKNIIVNIQVMMDPTRWDSCIDAVDYYKNSKYKWTIRHAEILHATINYTASQLAILQMLRPRSQSPWFYLRNNKTPSSKVVVIDSAGKKSKIADHIIVLERLNNFKGWECDVGVDWINIKADGTISGICGNSLYDQSAIYNIYDNCFNETFQPTITPTVCRTDCCWCTFETNMPKRKLDTSNVTKIIPIHVKN
jgi:MoaA/NifB/PqqE/SkfB family radical SAM enzyme